ncbi:MAG: tetratricopeptide repeat protein [Acidaminobacteraceae bacterium]
MLEVKLLGIPEIKLDNNIVNIPYKKAEAVFYYLLVNKTATRDEIVNLLWGDVSEEVARKNLRNAIYRIKKALGIEIIISPQKNTLAINNEILIALDYYNLFDDEKNLMEISKEEFLRGFYVKNEEYFENWVYETNEIGHKHKVKKLKEKALLVEKESPSESIEIYEYLLEIDKLDEEVYENAIRVYLENGKLQKANQIFSKLKNVLEEEIGIEPDSKIEEMIKKFKIGKEKKINKTKKSKENNISEIIGRRDEINIIESELNNYIGGSRFKNIAIKGEAGIGKTSLHDYSLSKFSQSDVCVFRSSCYKVDQDFYLKPWSDILKAILALEDLRGNISYDLINPIKRIFPSIFVDNDIRKHKRTERSKSTLKDNIDSNNIEEIVCHLLNTICESKKVILSFEDIHWMDKQSTSLLIKILDLFREKIFIIFTYRSSYTKEMKSFINNISEYNSLLEIKLKEFSRDETEEFLNNSYSDKIDEELLENIYMESEGVPFFIKEYLNMITDNGEILGIPPRIAGILSSRFSDLSKSAKQIANISSVFTRNIDFEILHKLSGKDEFELIDILEELKNKSILKESINENSLIIFSHSKIKEFIYEKMSYSMKKIIHKKIAIILEESLNEKNIKKSADIFSDLIYHYGKSDELLDQLKYKLGYLSLFLDYSHELYPILKNGAKIENNKILLDKKSVNYEFESIEKSISDLKSIYDIEFLKEHIARFYYVKGRYLIREGHYSEGSDDIKFQIELSSGVSTVDTLKGYKQLIYLSIQTHDVISMKLYLDKSFDVLKMEVNIVEEGILTRLLGLYYIMLGKYDVGKKSLDRAIDLFNSDRLNKDKYILNIAACYNYLGEINRRMENYEESIAEYRKAIEICKNNNLASSMPIFYTNIGQVAFEMNDFKKAKEYFEDAIKLYDESGTLWNRTIAEVYLSLIYLKEKKYKLSYDYLLKGDRLGAKIQSPYDYGLVNYGKFLIWSEIKEDKELEKKFDHLLGNLGSEYLEIAIKYFEKANATFEIDRLKNTDAAQM